MSGWQKALGNSSHTLFALVSAHWVLVGIASLRGTQKTPLCYRRASFNRVRYVFGIIQMCDMIPNVLRTRKMMMTSPVGVRLVTPAMQPYCSNDRLRFPPTAARLLRLLHLLQRAVDVVCGVGSVGVRAVPRPHLLFLLRELALQHGNHLFANDGQELPAVERAARGEVEVVAAGVLTDEEVVVGGVRVPGGISRRSRLSQTRLTSRNGTLQSHSSRAPCRTGQPGSHDRAS